MKKSAINLLVTGFGPFQVFDKNPSADLIAAINGSKFLNVDIRGIVLPVSWQDAWPLIQDAVETFKPKGLLSFGLAPEPCIRFETTARNYIDFDRDVNGFVPQNNHTGLILPDAPSIYQSTLPFEWLLEGFSYIDKSANPTTKPLPTRFSNDAGGYLCNFVFYKMMHFYQETIPFRGLIHIPAYGSWSSFEEFSDDDIVRSGTTLVNGFSSWLSNEFKDPQV
jgi:pyroglutamyl-peptidase